MSHPGNVNLELVHAPTSPYHAILMLLMIVPCIIYCLTCLSLLRSTSYNMQGQFNKDTKLQPTMENTTHPQMDTTMRTLRPETSKRGRPNTPRHPNSAGSSQKDLYAPIPKELASHLLRGECQVVRIVNRSPKWLWLKDKEGKSPGKQKKGRSREGPRTGVGTSGRQTAFLASLICIGQAQWESKT